MPGCSYMYTSGELAVRLELTIAETKLAFEANGYDTLKIYVPAVVFNEQLIQHPTGILL